MLATPTGDARADKMLEAIRTSNEKVPKKEKVRQAKYRKMLRGKWLILCDKCDHYFEGEEIVAKSHIDYCGNAPWDSKWRKAEEARTKKRFEEEGKQSRLDA